MIIGGLLSLIFMIWMLVLVGKQSVLLAVLCFFFWPALIYALFKYWGEEGDIKLPFALWVVACAYAWYDLSRMAREMNDQQESLLAIIQLMA
jgi:hypothetical protein